MSGRRFFRTRSIGHRERTDAVPDPVTGYFDILEREETEGIFPVPGFVGKAQVGWPGKKLEVGGDMLEARQCPARMVPRSHDDYAAGPHLPEEWNRELRILQGGERTAFDGDIFSRNAFVLQPLRVSPAVANAAHHEVLCVASIE